jgi:hypothetical protein
MYSWKVKPKTHKRSTREVSKLGKSGQAASRKLKSYLLIVYTLLFS